MIPKEIKSIDPYDWTEILAASRSEGHNMVNRLLDDFKAGTNRFDAPGELLLADLQDETVVAVAGLNVEPEQDLRKAGRVRRLYVVPRCRGNGLARSLVDRIVAHAAHTFDVLTVHVGTSDARGFYEHLGFTPVDHAGITHMKQLPHNKASHDIAAKRGSA
jgi:N-acetylglutamate synthase-like GNAT family acetyltransferase